MKTKQNAVTLTLAGFLAIAFTSAVQAQPQSTTGADQKATGSVTKAKGPKAVNNAVCPVSGEPIGSMGEGVKVTYKGSIVTLCCKSCADEFNANPEEYVKKAKAAKKLPTTVNGKTSAGETTKSATSASALKDVKNANCPVSGKAIGSMGEGVTVAHNGYNVTLCCAGCKARFEANPDEYLQKALNDTKRS